MMGSVIRQIAMLTRPLFERNVYTVRSGVAAGLKRRGGLGFMPRAVTGEEQFMLSLNLNGQVVYDIGAYEGIFTMFFARAAGPTGKLFVWEPNPRNVAVVEGNMALNGFRHVQVFPVGIGDRADSFELTFPKGQFAQGTVEPGLAKQIGARPDSVRITVPIDTLDHQIVERALPAPQFIKLDIEGMELPALHGMVSTLRAHMPTLYIEIHGADVPRKEANIAAVSAFLLDLGYSIRHVESGVAIGRDNSRVAREGHIYCVLAVR